MESLLFFHPVIWWLSSWLRLEREVCCDRLVIERTGRSSAYVEMLVDLAGSGHARRHAMMAMADRQITTRIRRILNLEERSMKLSLPEGFGLLAAMTIAIGISFGARAGTTDVPQDKPKHSNAAMRKALHTMAEQASAVRLDSKRFDSRGAALMDIARAQFQIGDRQQGYSTMRDAGRALTEGANQAEIPAMMAAVVAQVRVAEASREAGVPDLAREMLDLATKSLVDSLVDPKSREALATIEKERRGDVGDPAAFMVADLSTTLIEERIALGDLVEARHLIRWCVKETEGIKGKFKVELSTELGSLLNRAGDKKGCRSLLMLAEHEALSLPAASAEEARLRIASKRAECGDFDAAIHLFKAHNNNGLMSEWH